jgi:hypothetical protein
MNDVQAARGLGLFSIGLGLAELTAPRWLGRQMGTGPRHALLRALGAREIASGIGVLAQRQPATALWSRVAGDVMDLSLLGCALVMARQGRGRIAAAIAMVVGVSWLDLRYARRWQRLRSV